jgi:nucleoredoxin
LTSDFTGAARGLALARLADYHHARGMKSRFVALALIGWIGLAGVGYGATLAEIAASPQTWPAEVTVLSAARGTAMDADGNGSRVLIGPGKLLPVVAVTEQGVTTRFNGKLITVPLEKTDLLTRLTGPVGASVANAAVATPSPIATAATMPPTAPVAAAAASGPTVMSKRFEGKLVRSEKGRLQAADDASLNGVKYYALYFSASWCPPCRGFTPGLVNAYARLKAAHPDFELVFVSSDNSEGAMSSYMKDYQMAWPALKFNQRQWSPEILRYSGKGIPCLVFVDANGKVLSDSYRSGRYVGPGVVLADIERILSKQKS